METPVELMEKILERIAEFQCESMKEQSEILKNQMEFQRISDENFAKLFECIQKQGKFNERIAAELDI